MKRKKRAKRRARWWLVLAALLLAVSSFSLGGRRSQVSAPEATNASEQPPEETLHAVPSPTGHIHSWETIQGTVHREAVTEEVWVLDTEAWLEPRETAKAHCACRCGMEGTYDEVKAHIQSYKVAWGADPNPETEAAMQKHVFDTSNMDDWIVHEAGGHWDTQVIQEAYDGPGVVGYRCPVCGEERT